MYNDQDYRDLSDLRDELEAELIAAKLAGDLEGAAKLEKARGLVHDAIGRIIGAPITSFLASIAQWRPSPSGAAVRATLRGTEGM